MTKRQTDRLRNEHNVARQNSLGRMLPCGHQSRGNPISETRTAYWYRCSAGCGLIKVRRTQ